MTNCNCVFAVLPHSVQMPVQAKEKEEQRRIFPRLNLKVSWLFSASGRGLDGQFEHVAGNVGNGRFTLNMEGVQTTTKWIGQRLPPPISLGRRRVGPISYTTSSNVRPKEQSLKSPLLPKQPNQYSSLKPVYRLLFQVTARTLILKLSSGVLSGNSPARSAMSTDPLLKLLETFARSGSFALNFSVKLLVSIK